MPPSQLPSDVPFRPPETVVGIAARLEQAGHEAWCVGGAVRDALLGHPHLDWDLATSATPDQVRALFGHRRTVPVGIEFGTVGVLDRDGVMHEVTTFRRDVRTDGRHAVVEFGASLEDDLARRDFTINAMAYSASTGELRDPFGGREDLRRGLVRAVGDAGRRMEEDRLRALRALRFSARFDFAIDPDTHRAIQSSAPYLGRLSAERVKQELDKTMEQVRCPSRALLMWRDTGAFSNLIPPLSGLSTSQLSVPDWLAQPGLTRRPQRRFNRMAGLLASLNSGSAAGVLEALRSSKQEIQWVAAVVGRSRALSGEISHSLVGGAAIPDGAVRRWVATAGRLHVGAVMRVIGAGWRAAGADGAEVPEPPRVRSLYRRMLGLALTDALEVGDLAVDGDDLRRAGIPPGPRLGKILHTLVEVVLDDQSRNTADWLLHEAKRLYESPDVVA